MPNARKYDKTHAVRYPRGVTGSVPRSGRASSYGQNVVENRKKKTDATRESPTRNEKDSGAVAGRAAQPMPRPSQQHGYWLQLSPGIVNSNTALAHYRRAEAPPAKIGHHLRVRASTPINRGHARSKSRRIQKGNLALRAHFAGYRCKTPRAFSNGPG